MNETLRAAALRLTSPDRAEREAGEDALVAARDAAVPALIELLHDVTVAAPGALSFSPVARAALLLGALRARAAVPALCAVVRAGRLVGDDGAFVARSLAEILDGRDAFDDDVRAALEALSGSRDLYTRAYAAEAYGAIADLRSRARIQALASDAAPWVRERAQAVLMRLADVDAKTAADSISLADFAALVDEADRTGGAMRPFLDDLNDERRAVRDAAVNELVKAGRLAVPFLIDRLNQPQVRARIGAAIALGRLQPPEAAGPLLIAATTTTHTAEDRELRPIALRALANCLTGLEEGLAPSILPLAADPDRFTRAAALLCLGRLGDRRGMRAIVAAILEDDPLVVESAAVALSEGVREEDGDLVRPLLVALAKRPPPRVAVREAILIALSRIAIEAPAWRVRARRRVRRELEGGSASMRKAAVVLLERMYSDDDPPPLSVVDDVLCCLDDEHREVRVVAASFLARHLPPGLTGAAARLRVAIDGGDRIVSLSCIDALVRHHTEAARVVVAAAGNDVDEFVATQARAALGAWGACVAEWRFTPRREGGNGDPAPVAPPRPALTPSQRPPPRAAANQPRPSSTPLASSASPSSASSPSVSARPSRVRPAEHNATVVEARDPSERRS
jgi:HEAT repeat protein